MADIRIEGVDKLIAKLGKVQGIAVLRKPMQRSVYRLWSALGKEPPAIPTSRYKRGSGMMNSKGVVTRLTSEHLSKRWTTKVTQSANGLTGKVGNNVSYAPWVQSDRFQAAVHKGRWSTEVQVAEKMTPAIVADFGRAIREALR